MTNIHHNFVNTERLDITSLAATITHADRNREGIVLWFESYSKIAAAVGVANGRL